MMTLTVKNTRKTQHYAERRYAEIRVSIVMLSVAPCVLLGGKAIPFKSTLKKRMGCWLI
jgi:hypothetical protein